jgi:hypothetical protein
MPEHFRTSLLWTSWIIPGFLAVAGLLLIPSISLWPLALIGLACLVAVLRATSEIVVADGAMRSRYFGSAQRVDLSHLTDIRTDVSKASLGFAPALRLTDATAAHLSLRLGWWKSEPTLLGILAEAVEYSGAQVDAEGAEILRMRPTGESWDATYRSERPAWVRRRRR